MKTTGDRIRRLRERNGWTQLELADAVKINNSVLSRIESGKRPVEDELLVRFADVFNTSADYLLGLGERIREPSAMYGADTDPEISFFAQLREMAFYEEGKALSDKEKQIVMEMLLDAAKTARKMLSRTAEK